MKGLIKGLAELKEEHVLSEVKAMKQRGVEVQEIIYDLQEGILFVGEKFELKKYYLPELVISAGI